MSLIRCPECGNSISDRAEKCPHCGLPASYFSPFGRNTPHVDETGLNYKDLQNVLISFERDYARLFSAEHYISHRDAQGLRDTYGAARERTCEKQSIVCWSPLLYIRKNAAGTMRSSRCSACQKIPAFSE